MRLSKELTELLGALARRHGVTLFEALVATYYVVLRHHTGASDITIGTSMAGRRLSVLEPLIGFFINNVALRIHASPDSTFDAVLAQSHQAVQEAYANQDAPADAVAQAIQPSRRASHASLFQTLFVFQSAPKGVLQLRGLTLEGVEVPNRQAKFDLALSMEDGHDGLTGFLEYDTALFDSCTIKRMAEHIETLLAVVVRTSERAISIVPMLTAAQEHQLLREWNDTDLNHYPDECLHRLFERHARITPDRPALIYEDECLSYGELDRRSTLLAGALRKRGIGPDTPVGIFVERSPEMIVGVLGILKAGAAYVPLDTEFPQKRLTHMIEDAAASVVLTTADFVEKLPPGGYLPLTLEGILEQGIQDVDLEPMELPVTSLAEITWTSGSTGRPKGVGLAHLQLANYVRAIHERLRVEGPLSFATVSTLSADLGNTSIYGALCAGGTLHVVSKERLHDPTGFTDYFEARQVDVLKIVPSHFRAMQDAFCGELPLRYLIVGGEASYSAWSAEILSRSHSCTIINHYAPTEATIGILTNGVAPTGADAPAVIPLGRPRGVYSVTCTSPVSASGAVTSTVSRSRRSGSCLARSDPRVAGGCTAPEIARGLCGMAMWSFWDASISRYRFAASGWNQARSRPCWRATRCCATWSSQRCRMQAEVNASLPMSFPKPEMPSKSPRSESTSRRSFQRTWCPRLSLY